MLDYLDIREPSIVMGCSIGGTLAMDFALAEPSRVKGLIMVSSEPSGLELDVETPAIFSEAEEAYKAGDLDLVAEIETQIWFDGIGRSPQQVNQRMRSLAYEMNRKALSHYAMGLGKRQPDAETPAVERLTELEIPVLVVAGARDIPFTLAAADYMVGNIGDARKVLLDDAAHLCNLDHPEAFQREVRTFLDTVSR